jgi:molecular chaperone DnaK (HSP70)
LRTILGGALLSANGIAIKTVPGSLAAARAAPSRVSMGLIFEATAAAAYTSIGLEESASHLIVIDVGAGTTDISAMARRGKRMEELPAARTTLKQAGDFIDRTIADLVVQASPWAKSAQQQTELWTALMRRMRDIKESLFVDGRAILRNDGRVLTLNLRDLERDKDFRAFSGALEDAFDNGLAIVRDAALKAERREVQAIAVGGGASAPFIQDLIRRKPPRSGKLNFVARPATPDWAHARVFRGNLAPVFPQLAIAIGGALAPAAMLAAPADCIEAV